MASDGGDMEIEHILPEREQEFRDVLRTVLDAYSPSNAAEIEHGIAPLPTLLELTMHSGI